MSARLPLVLGPGGLVQQLPAGDTLAVSSGMTSTIPSFATVADAISGAIPDAANNAQTAGFYSPGDNGSNIYRRVNSLTTPYVGKGTPGVDFTAIPPGFSSGVPYLVFGSTWFQGNETGVIGPTSQPILAHCLTVIAAFLWTHTTSTSITDSVGNTYIRAVHDGEGATDWPTAMYYCADPVAAPVGTTFKITDGDGTTNSTGMYVYCVPGFIGAVLDKTASQVISGARTGISLSTTGGLASIPAFAFGSVYVDQIPSTRDAFFPYTPPAGWIDLMPPVNGQCPISCMLANGAGDVTYNPTWALASLTYVSLLAVFYAVPAYSRTSFDPSHWEAIPSFPAHTTQYGISLSNRDNSVLFRQFGTWLASVAPPSWSSEGRGAQGSWTAVISVANPAVVTVTPPIDSQGFPWVIQHGFRSGQLIRFLGTDGALPAPIIGGKAYYVYYGSVTPVGFSISETSIWDPGDPTTTHDKGNPVNTLGAGTQSGGVGGFGTISPGSGYGANADYYFIPLTGGSGSGATAFFRMVGGAVSSVLILDPGRNYLVGDTLSVDNTKLAGTGSGFSVPVTAVSHAFTAYGEGWMDIILDPGVYFAKANSTYPGLGVGFKKWRLHGYGAKLQTLMHLEGIVWNDVNANTSGSGLAFSTQFKTTDPRHPARPGDQVGWPNSVTLTTTGLTSNFHVNSWALLMQNETQDATPRNWNQFTFEFARIKSIDAATDTIIFYDPIQYNYRSTLPKFSSVVGGFTQITGPATIVQVNDTFDQEVEIHGLAIVGQTEENFVGLLSIKLVDCDIYGYGFKTAPFPSTMRSFMMVGCRVHSAVMEVDKMIDFMALIDCTYDSNSALEIGSAGVNKLIIERCRFANIVFAPLKGLPKNTTIRDSYIAGSISAGTVLGVNERIWIENSHVQSMVNDFESGQPIPVVSPAFSFVNGTLKVAPNILIAPGLGTWLGSSTPGSTSPVPWAVPGGRVAITTTVDTSGLALGRGISCVATIGMLTAFTVLDVRVDGSDNYCVDTNMAALPATSIAVTGTMSGTNLTVTSITPSDACLLMGMLITATAGGTLPAGTTISRDIGIPNATGNNLGVYVLSNAPSSGSPTSFTVSTERTYLVHPAPRLTIRNCTGGRWVSDMAGSPADIPMYSYFRRAFGGLLNIAYDQEAYVLLAGNLLQWTIDVQKPYTGAAGTFTCTISMFGWKTVGSNTYPVYIDQVINLKNAGVRTITASASTTTSNATFGDTLTSISFWLTGGHLVHTTTPGAETLDQMPFFIMQAQAKQGVDFGSLVVTTVSGLTELSDTVMATAVN